MNCTNNKFEGGTTGAANSAAGQSLSQAASNMPFSTPYLNSANMRIISNANDGTLVQNTVPYIDPVSSVNLQNSVTAMQNNGTAQMQSTQQDNIPETVTNTMFWPAYLRKFIGKWVRVDFFIGTALEQRIGQLLEVGASYVVLNVLEPETILICDIYAIKFVTVVLDADYPKLYM